MKNYPFMTGRRGVWKEIVRYVHKDNGNVGSVLEIGSGYCDFITQFPAIRRLCIEQNIEMKKYAGEDVEFICDDATNLEGIDDLSMDLVFTSNFLEHLDQSQLDRLMPKIHQALVKQGKLVLLQPNYRLCANHYFDDETHQTIFSDENITEFLSKYGFRVVKLVSGLLPFSMNSRLPKIPILVRLYLNSPIRPFAAQMYVIAEKR